MIEPGALLMDFPAGLPPETLSKKAFSELVGVTQGRVSQMVADGLPVEPNGRINVARGKEWMRQNIDPTRRRASLDQPQQPMAFDPVTPRAKRAVAEAEIAHLKAERLAGRLIDRAATLRVVEARARAERDALIGWVNRAASAVAVETGANLATVTAVLDREIRDHLRAMAERQVELPK